MVPMWYDTMADQPHPGEFCNRKIFNFWCIWNCAQIVPLQFCLKKNGNKGAILGFDKPILHGLCSFGFAVKHILQAFCDNDVTLFKSVKVGVLLNFTHLKKLCNFINL